MAFGQKNTAEMGNFKTCDPSREIQRPPREHQHNNQKPATRNPQPITDNPLSLPRPKAYRAFQLLHAFKFIERDFDVADRFEFGVEAD